mmetsp:Transcript_32826/g.70881  ORF Transcript_32826/g.70881 Transcript_32826/m.70881 type:complete len:210 (-) Transcript_32826:401-1030(-)
MMMGLTKLSSQDTVCKSRVQVASRYINDCIHRCVRNKRRSWAASGISSSRLLLSKASSSSSSSSVSASCPPMNPYAMNLCNAESASPVVLASTSLDMTAAAKGVTNVGALNFCDLVPPLPPAPTTLPPPPEMKFPSTSMTLSKSCKSRNPWSTGWEEMVVPRLLLLLLLLFFQSALLLFVEWWWMPFQNLPLPSEGDWLFCRSSYSNLL